MRCEACGAEIGRHVCATSNGRLLCWECFRKLLMMLRRRDGQLP